MADNNQIRDQIAKYLNSLGKNKIYDMFSQMFAKAKINLAEDSAFPKDEYKIYLKRVNPRLKTPPYVNIESVDEQFHVLMTTNGRIIQVKSYGKRPKNDRFSDISEKMKSFVAERSLISGKLAELGATNDSVIKFLWKLLESANNAKNL